jgi:hypothetical protein
MKKLRQSRKRVGTYSVAVLSCLTLVLASFGTIFFPMFNSSVAAYGQATARSVEISDSTDSATGVSYEVQFTTSDSIQSVVLDFCPDSPLYADTCSTLNGFTAAGAGFTAGAGTTGWSITASAQHIDVHGTAATGTISFTLTNITNPSATGSYYARIYAYTTNPDNYVSTTNPGTVADFGGIALTTTTALGVTARVQEELTFCVAGVVITNNCANAGANPPNLTIGHGSPTLILDSTEVDTATAYMQTSSNAQSGVAVRMKNANSCGGMSSDNGATCGIPAVGPTATTLIAGTPDYGMDVGASSGGIGSVTPVAPYDASGQYAMDNTSVPDNVTSTYGSLIAQSSTGTTNVNNPLTFAAAASNTTPAGIYTATMTLIATGTF